MNKALADAVWLIEEAGGIVIMQDQDDMPNVDDLVEKEAQEAIELKRWQEERKENLENLHSDFSKAISSENFSIDSVAEICYGNGCDIDDLEQMIHGGMF